MINFETRYDEHTARWQFRLRGASEWSAPMRLPKMAQALHAEVAEPEPEVEAKRWSKPIDHSVRGRSPRAEAAKTLYEIKGGKVQRIASSAKERNEQQMAELLAIMEGLNDE